MAIDPTIALKAGQVPQGGGMLGGMERGLKLQQLAMQPALLQQQIATARQAELASAAQTDITRAQLPGVQAEAAGRVRAEQLTAAKVKAAQEAFDFDDKGNPVLDPNTNQPKFNVAKYQYGLYRSGQFDEAVKAGADVLKQSKDAYDFTATARSQAALAAKAAYDRTPGTPEQKQKAAEATWRDMSQRAISASAQAGFPISEDQLRYIPGLEQVLYTASINPATQEQLKQGMATQDIQRDQLALQTEQFENSKKLNFTDEASMDPNSGVSQRTRAIVENMLNIQLPPEMSAAEIYRNETYKGAMQSVGANVGVQRAAAQQEVTKYNSLNKAIDMAKDDLSRLGFTPAQLLSNIARGKFVDNPRLTTLAFLLQQNNLSNYGGSFATLKMLTEAQLKHAEANVSVAAGVGPEVSRRPAPAQSRTTAPAQPGAAPAQPAGKFVIGSQHQDPATGIIYRYTGKGKTGFEKVE